MGQVDIAVWESTPAIPSWELARLSVAMVPQVPSLSIERDREVGIHAEFVKIMTGNTHSRRVRAKTK